MPLNNINTLQNYEDLRYVSYLSYQFADTGELNTDYYIHALANMEQRNEYRYSNGIKYGILTYDKDVEYNINDLNGTSPTAVILNNTLAFDITVNNVEKYLKNSQIYNDGDNFKTLMFCKVLGTDDSDNSKNVEIQYTNIDLSSHVLVEAYRAFYLSDTIYVLLHIYVDNVIGNTLNAPIISYKLKCYKLDLSTNDALANLFNHTIYNSDNSDNNILKDINVNNCTEHNGLFESLKNMSIYNQETIENNYTIDCTYDTIDEQYIKITDISLLSKGYHNINDLLYFNYYKIDNYITSINNDLTISYPNLLKYYSNRQFNSNADTLKDVIARALFNHIYNELSNEFDEDELNKCRLVIPTGTQITYVSNVENSLMLHYTDDIYVFFINDSETNKSLHIDDTSIRFEYPGIDKTVLYNIVSKYNTKFPEFIDSFIVTKKYILPYIDDSHLWNINGNQTSIYASGESGGNPNILMIQTYLENDTLYGKHLNRTDIQQNLLQYETKFEQIHHADLKNEINVTSKYLFKIPIINQKTLDKLKYATLFAISNIIDTGTDDEHNYQTAPQMTTIWTISDNNNANNSEFELVRTVDGNPLTIETMFGLDSYIYEKFVEYGHISNIFDDLVAIKLPKYSINGSETNSGNNYFVIERNTALDKINTNIYPENAYNYNTVEMKLSDHLNGDEYSYAESSEYINRIKLSELWQEQENKVIQPYKLANTIEYIYADNDEGQSVTVVAINGEEQSIQTGNQNTSDIINEFISTHPHELIYDIGQYENISITNNSQIGEFIINEQPVTKINEYIPMCYIPIIKESNILHQDSNIINRSNILSFDENGKIYYSYIGSSCNDNDKKTVHIGTCENTSYVLSIGTDSLSSGSKVLRDKYLKPAEKLSIDFTETKINSKVTTIQNTAKTNEINVDTFGDNTVIRIDLYHIFNDYIQGQNIISIDDEQTSNFNSINVHPTNLGNYINSKYNDLLNSIDINNIQISNSSISLSKKGYYDDTLKIVMFDDPIRVFIIKNNANVSIQIL